ncbi:MAG: hypothetical protein HC942_23090 [Microcoleus sp. SU_5_6]|nr:hypothetical protein [Microcoleus sp. SU_5_6]
MSKPGTSAIEAALQVAKTLENPRQMAVLWEAIKARVTFLREEWRRQSSNGVQNAVVDPWMRPKESVSDEVAAIALNELQQNLPQQLQASKTVLAFESEIASSIEPEAQNLGPEIDIEEQKRNISRLAQMLRGKRGDRCWRSLR